jgi:hypothetical protein
MNDNGNKGIEEYKNKKKDFQTSFIILMGFCFFFLFFIILPYSLVHTSLISKTISPELVYNISSLSDSTERIFDATMEIKNLSEIKMQGIQSIYSELTNYFTSLESLQSERLLNYTQKVDLGESIPTFLNCVSIRNSTQWIYCNADIVADNVADKILDDSNKFIKNKLLIPKQEFLDAVKNYNIIIKNIDTMSKANISRISSFDYSSCLKTIDNQNGFFKNIDTKEACDFLNDVRNSYGKIKDLKYRLSLIFNSTDRA